MKFFRLCIYIVFCTAVLLFIACEKDLNTEPETSQLRLITPDNTTEWNAGSECLISWINITGQPVKIDMYEKNGFVLNIGTFADIMTEYNYTLPLTLEPGTGYYLRLYAVEKPENYVSSQTFTVLERVNAPPVCTIIDPKDGKYVMTGDIVQITVSAEDTDGEIDCVKFYIDGEYAGEMPKASFVFPWPTEGIDIGLHSITAIATDDRGAESLLSKVNVVITDGHSPVELIKVPLGWFYMGSLSGDYDERPVNYVLINWDYYMSKFEITNGQYAEMLNYALAQNELTGDYLNDVTVMNLNGKQRELLDLDDNECGISFDGTKFYVETNEERKPVIELTWWGAAFYCNMLSRQQNVEELYDMELWKCDFDKTGYRLPTEAEWEYAARYNDNRKYPWGLTDPDPSLCNYALSVGRTVDVGSYSPQGDTALGFCDMAGNAWEWCNDWYGYYPTVDVPLVYPTGPNSGSSKVLRGGNANSSDYNVRTTYRNCYNLTSGYFHGMRIVLSIR